MTLRNSILNIWTLLPVHTCMYRPYSKIIYTYVIMCNIISFLACRIDIKIWKYLLRTTTFRIDIKNALKLLLDPLSNGHIIATNLLGGDPEVWHQTKSESQLTIYNHFIYKNKFIYIYIYKNKLIKLFINLRGNSLAVSLNLGEVTKRSFWRHEHFETPFQGWHIISNCWEIHWPSFQAPMGSKLIKLSYRKLKCCVHFHFFVLVICTLYLHRL